MPRPAPWRLDAASYPVIETVQTRFQHLDPMGHLNNVAIAALFETARVNFNKVAGRFGADGYSGKADAGGFRGVVASNTINYLAEGSYPEPVDIASGVGHIGNRSWEILEVMIQSGRAIATSDTVLVMNASSGARLPDEFRAKLEALRVKDE